MVESKLKKPDWIRVKAPVSKEYQGMHDLMRRQKLNTVCEEAACPNVGECWGKRHATIMILGSTCTRACTFCNIKKGRPDLLDPHEPERVAEAVGDIGLLVMFDELNHYTAIASAFGRLISTIT